MNRLLRGHSYSAVQHVARFTKARQIKDQLEKGGFRNATDMLSERLAACESCDLLASKDIKHTRFEDVKKLLTLSKDAWHLYPPFIKAKLAQNYVMQVRLLDLAEAFGLAQAAQDQPEQEQPKGTKKTKKAPKDSVEAMTSLALSIRLANQEGQDEKFDVWCPTFSRVVVESVGRVEDKLVDKGSCSRREVAATMWTLGISAWTSTPHRLPPAWTARRFWH